MLLKYDADQPAQLGLDAGLIELYRKRQPTISEQLHALARDVFYGRRARINARELWEQMNICSCLNLILACIVYGQACGR